MWNFENIILTSMSRFSFSFTSSAFKLGLLVFLLTLAVTQYLVYLQYRIQKDEQSKKAVSELNSVATRLKTTLSNGMSATKVLAFIVEKYGEPEDFNAIAEEIVNSHQYIDGIQLTRGGVIKYVYPLEENKAALEFDILSDSSKSVEAYKSIKEKKLFFAGPLELKQGGVAVIGRLPIYSEDQFIGFSAVIIKLSTLLRSAGIPQSGQSGEFKYQLSKLNPLSQQKDFFLPYFDSSKEVASATLEIPDGEWILDVSSKATTGILSSIIIYSVLGLMFSIIGGFSISQLASQPERLNKLVQEKTAKLIATENNISMMMGRVSDAFISFDKNLCYSYLNKRAVEIFGHDPQTILGKCIWKEFPQMVQTPIYEAYMRAMNTQEHVNVEYYFSENGRWLENHLYPSPNGLSVFIRDITPYKEAIQKLEASEKYFRALTENSTDAIVLLNDHGKVLYQSPSTQKISGYSLEEIRQLDGLALIHPEDRLADSEMFINLIQTPGKVFHRNHRFKHKNGHYIWLEGAYINLLADPNIKAIVYNYHDATERMLAEQAIVREKYLSDSIINSLPGIFYLYDRDGKFIRWNKNFELVSGYSSDEIKHLKPLDFFEGEDKELVRQKIESVFMHGKDEVEAHFYTKAQKKIPYYLNGCRIILDDTEYLLGMGVDITELKLTEAKASALIREKETTLNRINDGVVSLNTEWQYTFLNDAALATHPLGREETIGKTILEVHPEMKDSPFWEMYQQAMQSMKVMELENYYAPMDTWFSSKVYPSQNGITIFYKDITERKKAEQQTAKLLASLQAKNKDLQQFSYIVSHNLRAPIAKILGLIDILDDNAEDNQQIIKLIAETATDLDEVVKDINLIVSARRTNQEIYEHVLFERKLQKISEVFQNEITKYGVTITSDFSEVESIYCIKTYVYSILYNLISNSIKYRAFDRPAQIHVKTTKSDDFVCLMVIDNGIGIDMQKYGSKLFGLYKRFHSDSVPGKGVGLNLVKTHAESLGGRVEAESILNEGSVFKVYLPNVTRNYGD